MRFGGGEGASCATTIPSCSDPDRIDVGDLRDALAHPDVAAAWAARDTVIYGFDSRPVDGSVWFVRRAPESGDPDEILVGGCRDPDCGETPLGLLDLKDLLEALRAQEKATAECEVLLTKPSG